METINNLFPDRMLKENPPNFDHKIYAFSQLLKPVYFKREISFSKVQMQIETQLP